MNTANDSDPIIIVFNKAQIRERKFDHFLKLYGRDSLPEGPKLAALMGRFQFIVQGYDNDPAELYGIPEVRKFYQQVYRVWPYWFYFCDLRTETLCLMPNLSSVKRVGEPLTCVECNPMEIIAFISKNFGPLNLMMERAGMSELAIYVRTREVFEHYRLPFDAPPPEDGE
ncbi:hypothetical protein [Haloferula sp.]|uniref:hypothetical protein n=1 Tax=Haloferula sp. TaxID=2497595 RepID=UPI003C734F09